MKKLITILKVFILSLLISNHIFGQEIGDQGWTFDGSKYDFNYPEMIEYAKAGVEGGIPLRNTRPIVQVVSVVYRRY